MLLYPMVKEDLEFMLEVRNEARESVNDNRTFTLDECLEWYNATHPENYIVLVAGRRVGVMRVRRNKQHTTSVEIGGDIHVDHRRKGYALRAYKILIPVLFIGSTVNEIFLEVLIDNMPAFNLYRKLGFEISEYKPEMARRFDGWLEGWVMNLTEQKWRTVE